jgi:hypothetical protein
LADDRRILELIDDIYDAALDSSRWPKFIASLSQMFDGLGGILQQRERDSAEVGFIEYGGIESSARTSYEQYYRARSVWMPAAFVSSSELAIGHELAPDKQLFE